MEDLKHIIESLLFVAEEPLSQTRISQILDLPEDAPVADALSALTAEYEARKGGFYLSEVAGGYQLRTRPEYKEYIRRMRQNTPARLSKAALETLAIIAYKQPVLRSDVEHIRGVDCGGVLRQLLERKIIRILGRKEIPGRPIIYGTTKKFLEIFALKDLKDLPVPKEITDRDLPVRHPAAEDGESADAPDTPPDTSDDAPEPEEDWAADPETDSPDTPPPSEEADDPKNT